MHARRGGVSHLGPCGPTVWVAQSPWPVRAPWSYLQTGNRYDWARRTRVFRSPSFETKLRLEPDLGGLTDPNSNPALGNRSNPGGCQQCSIVPSLVGQIHPAVDKMVGPSKAIPNNTRSPPKSPFCRQRPANVGNHYMIHLFGGTSELLRGIMRTSASIRSSRNRSEAT